MQPLVTPVHNALPVELIADQIRTVCGEFSVEPVRGNAVVNGGVTSRRIGPFDAAVVSLDALNVTRDTRAIRQDPGEHFFLLVQDAGRCRVLQGDQMVDLARGDMFLVDSAAPSVFQFGGAHSHQISLHLPRAELVQRFGTLGTHGQAISRQDPLWLALRAVLAKMAGTPGPQDPLGEVFWGLMGAYLHSANAQSAPTPASLLLSRALALIERNRTDPSFGPGELARQLSISERTLQRQFKAIGETPGHRLLNRRLELAHSHLSARGGAARATSVTDIALSCGFNDLSYFYREFRKKYGLTPGDVARAC
ncbi:helix-turn-helix domain-containing protein [Phaeovulum sp. W22_SRMD_FR3]